MAGDLGIGERCACLLRENRVLFHGFSGQLDGKYPPNGTSQLLINRKKLITRASVNVRTSFLAALCPSNAPGTVPCGISVAVKAAELRLMRVMVTICRVLSERQTPHGMLSDAYCHSRATKSLCVSINAIPA